MTAFAPPDSPVPAPRGTTGTASSAHVRTTCCTSDSLRARTPAAASAGVRPFRVVARQARQRVGVDNNAVSAQPAAKRLEQHRVVGDHGLVRAAAIMSAVAAAPATLMIVAA